VKEKIRETLAGLKDFQLKTVDYVFEQLYRKGRNKMLIADEVGLGKTIVAKGIIAKAFARFRPRSGKETFTVVYVCSNQALARQNLNKLNFTGDPEAIDYSEDDDRLTALAYLSDNPERTFPFAIKAFTPATSFDDKTHAGKSDERILLYRLLCSYKGIYEYKNSLKWILKGNQRMRDDKWERKIVNAEAFEDDKIDNGKKIRPTVYARFRQELQDEVTPEMLPRSFAAAGLTYPVKFWTLIKSLCRLEIRKNNYYHYNFQRELISALRFRLSKICIDFLQADIFILDEFQRFKKLIDDGDLGEEDGSEKMSPAIALAREIFTFRESKILMLSATPFKPYTNDFDELNGEVHYQEFRTVLQFLMPEKSRAFWKEYEDDRKVFFAYLRHPDKLEGKVQGAMELKNKLEMLYRTGIVRTEKLLASDDRDALIRHALQQPVDVQLEDIQDFVVLDQITRLINKNYKASLPIPLEYVKSSPYAMSFMDNYQHKEKIRNLLAEDDDLLRLLKKTKHGWINLDSINNYRPLIPVQGKHMPNAKLRLLLNETVHNDGWKYLWIPPSVPYYTLQGAWKNSWGYSKTILFSSWKMVPRMVSSLVSYEAERLCLGNPNSISEKEKVDIKRVYFQRRRSPVPQFTFKVEQGDPQQMTGFMLTYPCQYLASLYDPASNVVDNLPLTIIRKKLKEQILHDFKKLRLNEFVTGRGDWQKWYWLAPLLLDKASHQDTLLKNWFEKGVPLSGQSLDAEHMGTQREESSGRGKHFMLAQGIFLSEQRFAAGRLNEQQQEIIAEHLVELTLGSPAVCYLRTQHRYQPISLESLDSAYRMASAFLTLFNKPESIAILRLTTRDRDYWQRTLEYATDGNIQAMLDEYVYLLYEGEGMKSLTALCEYITDVLSVRTANVDVDDLSSFINSARGDHKKKQAMRAHYAVDFGSQKISTASGAGRMINIRQAFNSPFRPFVLASTSIGQEGLDFHFYCKKIFHWNLPANPIDFEQREGRIHRYQGLVIRLNLADKYRHEITLNNSRNVWHEIFAVASKEKSKARFSTDLIPFWHTETNNNIKIDRYVPLYPFSRDGEKFEQMIKILTFYRLTFGQPRQQELIEALNGQDFDRKALERLEELIINLSPIRFF
jgi:hypothetical protein